LETIDAPLIKLKNQVRVLALQIDYK